MNDGQLEMNISKFDTTEKNEAMKLTVAIATVLLTLLCFSQFAFSADDLSSRFSPESNYDLLEVDDPENVDLELGTPDFVHHTTHRHYGDDIQWVASYSVVIKRDVHASSSHIRAPPKLS